MTYFEASMAIIRKIEELGSEAYLVGGCVRDILLKEPLNDIDITTNMPLDKIKENFNTFDNGIKYASITIKMDEYEYEITHFRRDISYSDNRHPIVEEVDTLKEDSKRRDFTINALAVNKDKKVIDYYNGLSDLKLQIIRCIGEPDKRFTEDSLRILRALYFSAKLGFYIHDDTLDSMIKNKKLLSNLSHERIYSYFLKILYGKYDYGIKYINRYDMFEYIPVYKDLLSCVKRTYRDEDLMFYYFLKYGKYLPWISKIDKKICDDLRLLVKNNFDALTLYKCKTAYLRCSNVLLNLGVNTKKIDSLLFSFPIRENSELKLTPEEISKMYDKDMISKAIDYVLDGILNKKINNEKDEILDYLKKW